MRVTSCEANRDMSKSGFQWKSVKTTGATCDGQPNLAPFSIHGRDISMEMEAWKKQEGNKWGGGWKKTKYQWVRQLIKTAEIRRSKHRIKGKDGWCKALNFCFLTTGMQQHLLQQSSSSQHISPIHKRGKIMTFFHHPSNLFLDFHSLGDTRSKGGRAIVSFPVS